MTGKRPSTKGSSKLGPEHEAEILRRMDEVPLELPKSPTLDEAMILRHARLISRVTRWVEANSPETVGARLAMEIVGRRWAEKDALEQCDLQARRKAVQSIAQGLNRRGTGCRHWPAVRKEWEKFRRDPSRYDGSRGFAAAMESKFPGVSAGTLSNKITQWKREEDSRNGES